MGVEMTEQPWHEARLIPTSGINGAEEQERRATSALLAVMGSVREFGRSLTQRYGAPAGSIETYIEVPFMLGEKRVYPDGLIRVTRAQKAWTALVEVKTGTNALATEQLENYLDVAREQEFDALITISNEIPPIAGQHPTAVDKRKLRKVEIHHLSWAQVLSEAVLQKEVRGVADPDQAWILGELIRYLEHPRSGALEFEDMGESWVPVREAVAAGTLRPNDKGVPDVAARFDALLTFASLRLGRQLGTEVTPLLSRKEAADPASRTQTLVASLASTGQMSGAIRIPDTVGPLVITADLRAGKVTCHVDIDAPRDGRSATRVNWLIRQLKDSPESVRIEAFVNHGRGNSAAELLKDVRVNPMVLLTDPSKELRSFRIAMTSPVGAKRGRGRGSFIDSVLAVVDAFYVEVVGQLRVWVATPPKLRSGSESPVSEGQEVAESLISTALSSQDGSSDADEAPAEFAPDARPEHALADETQSSSGNDTLPEFGGDPTQGEVSDRAVVLEPENDSATPSTAATWVH